jgi:hypothetical protein
VLRLVVSYKLTNVSEVFPASTIRAISCSSPWWWRQYAPLKRRSIFARLHGATLQKTITFILDAVRIWNITYCSFFNLRIRSVPLTLLCCSTPCFSWSLHVRKFNKYVTCNILHGCVNYVMDFFDHFTNFRTRNEASVCVYNWLTDWLPAGRLACLHFSYAVRLLLDTATRGLSSWVCVRSEDSHTANWQASRQTGTDVTNKNHTRYFSCRHSYLLED